MTRQRDWRGRQRLEDLLCDLFDEPGVRQWLRLIPDGDEVVLLIPGPPVALRSLVHAAVDVLLRRGLVDVHLFETLASAFPRRVTEVQQALADWIAARPEGSSRPPLAFDVPERRALAEALERAYELREQLLVRGQPSDGVDAEVLELRRQLRQGPQLRAGDILHHGRFSLVERIGVGGHAAVWSAYDRELRALVAVKILHGQWSADRTVRERFARGARNMARMRHPHIVHVRHGVFEDGEYVAYAMELLTGKDLQRRVLTGTLPTELIVPVFLDLCSALEHAHGHGFVHRDIKPSNVLLDAAGSARLTDFDMMKASDTTGGTADGAGIGTFLYAAPESMRDAGTVDERADVFSLGMTLLFCLLGRPLDIDAFFDPSRTIAALGCPDALKDVVRRAVQRDPTARFASARALAEALRAALGRPADTRVELATGEPPKGVDRYIKSQDWEHDIYHRTEHGAVEIIRGDICLQRVDAVVCGVDRQYGGMERVGRSLCAFGGLSVSQGLERARTLPLGEILSVNAGRLPSTYVFFAAQELGGTQPWPKQVAEILAASAQEADRHTLESLAVPLLFAGESHSRRTSLRWVLDAACMRLLEPTCLRKILVVIHDAGAVARHGGAITVRYPSSFGLLPEQRFLLSDHPTVRHLLDAIWNTMLLPYGLDPSLYAGRWHLQDAHTRAWLGPAYANGPKSDHTLSQAGIVPNAEFKIVLV